MKTPLMVAAWGGYMVTVKELLKHARLGHINARSKADGFTAVPCHSSGFALTTPTLSLLVRKHVAVSCDLLAGAALRGRHE